jgi:hypothetical protein
MRSEKVISDIDMKGYLDVILGMQPDLGRSFAATVVQASCGGGGALRPLDSGMRRSSEPADLRGAALDVWPIGDQEETLVAEVERGSRSRGRTRVDDGRLKR